MMRGDDQPRRHGIHVRCGWNHCTKICSRIPGGGYHPYCREHSCMYCRNRRLAGRDVCYECAHAIDVVESGGLLIP